MMLVVRIEGVLGDQRLDVKVVHLTVMDVAFITIVFTPFRSR